MANHKYRFMLPDGQTFEGTDLRKIRKVHPTARIVARIDFDDLGQGIVVPFEGKATADDDDGDDEPEAAPFPPPGFNPLPPGFNPLPHGDDPVPPGQHGGPHPQPVPPHGGDHGGAHPEKPAAKRKR